MAGVDSLARNISKTQSLPELLPWLDFFSFGGDDLTLLRNGNILGVAEIEACEAGLASDEELNATRNLYHSVARTIPVGYALTNTFIRRRASAAPMMAREGAPEVIRYLTDRQRTFWNDRLNSMYENRCLFALEATCTATTRTVPSLLLRELFGIGRPSFDMEAFTAHAERFYQVLHSTLDALSGKLSMRMLSSNELLAYYWYFLNPYQRASSESIEHDPSVTVARQVCGAHFDDSGTYFARIAGGGPDTHFAILTMNILPTHSCPAFWDSLTRLGSSRPDERVSEFWITTHYEPVNPDSYITSLNVRRNLFNAFTHIKSMQSIAQKSIALAADAAAVTHAIQTEKEGIGNFSLTAVVYDHDLSRLENTIHRIRMEASAKNCNFLVESPFARLAGYLTSLPGNSGMATLRTLNYRRAPILCANYSDLAPIYRDDEGDPGGGIILETPEGQFFRLDLFSPQANSWNAYFAGMTGAGKSFAANTFLESTMATHDIDLFILDIGLSYDPIVNAIPGSAKVSVSFDRSELALNPFSFATAPTQADRISLSHLMEYAITGGAGRLSQGDRVDIIRALGEIFEAYDPSDPPTLQNFYDHLEVISPELAKPLRMWLPDGPYEAFLNHKIDTFKDARVTYFELAGFDDHPDVAAVLVYLIFNKIFSRLTTPGASKRRPLIVLDECWKFLLNPIMADKIGELYRTIRKYGGAVHTLTQSPNDLISSDHRDAILSNTTFFFFLQQKALVDGTQKALDLNDREYQVLQNLRMVKGQYSEMFIKGPYRRHCRLRVAPHVYYMNTTHHTEKTLRNEIAEELGSTEKAVDWMVENRGKTVHRKKV